MNQEDVHLEYKREYVEDIKKTVVAFANTSGGKIYIGVDDYGHAIGVENPDDTMLKITSTIRDTIKPDVTLFTVCSREIIDNKVVILISVQKGTECPYYLAKKGIRPEGVYIRQGSASIPTSESTILKMIKDTSGDRYEEVRSLKQDLNFSTFEQEFLEANMNIGEGQKRSFGLIGEDKLYSNLALLLSEQCVHTIKIAVFEGNTKEKFKDRYEFKGSLFKQLRECYSFIDRYNRTRSTFDGLHRIDNRDYPIVAIREALLNAIIHRDYSFSGSLLVSIFDDRIEFVNIGGLVKGISRGDVELGISILRNKNLANIFYRLKLIEAFGTGIPKIMESYSDSLVVPKIELSDNAFKITLYNKCYQNSSINMSFDFPLLYTKGEQNVLKMFNTKKILKRKDIEKELSISQPMAVRYLKGLLDKLVIEKIGNGKNSSYRLK